ncbi:hypothetical protein HYW18_01720 [Candidatus Uhrbacteria bacterium]|nr:hypothetical protein [Candidatus Uhrbacteria bacterium]
MPRVERMSMEEQNEEPRVPLEPTIEIYGVEDIDQVNDPGYLPEELWEDTANFEKERAPAMRVEVKMPPAVRVRDQKGFAWPVWSAEEQKEHQAERIFTTLKDLNPLFVHGWMGRYTYSMEASRFEDKDGHVFPAPKTLELHGQTFDFEFLGAGGMARAYVGTSRETGKKIVMKIVAVSRGEPALVEDTIRKETMVAREIAAHAALHPGRNENGVVLSSLAKGIMAEGKEFSPVEAAHFPAFFDAIRLQTRQKEKVQVLADAWQETVRTREAIAVFMEYVEGSSFQRELIDHRRESLRVFQQGNRFEQLEVCSKAMNDIIDVLEALAIMNTRGLRHRDVKPANLMRGADGRLDLLDFGLAKGSRSGDVVAFSEATHTLWGKILHDAHALYTLVSVRGVGFLARTEEQGKAERLGELLPMKEQEAIWEALRDVAAVTQEELSSEEKIASMRELVPRLQRLVERYAYKELADLPELQKWSPRNWDNARMQQYLAALPDGEAIEQTQPSRLRSESPLETKEGNVVGTPLYIAPEQVAARAKVPDWKEQTKVDTFAVGVILMNILGHGKMKRTGVKELLEDRAYDKHGGLQYGDLNYNLAQMQAIYEGRVETDPPFSEAQKESLARHITEFKTYGAIPDTFRFVRQLTARSFLARPTPHEALQQAYQLKFKIENEILQRKLHADALAHAEKQAAS